MLDMVEEFIQYKLGMMLKKPNLVKSNYNIKNIK